MTRRRLITWASVATALAALGWQAWRAPLRDRPLTHDAPVNWGWPR